MLQVSHTRVTNERQRHWFVFEIAENQVSRQLIFFQQEPSQIVLWKIWVATPSEPVIPNTQVGK